MRRNFYFKEPFLRILEEQAVLMIFDMNGLILDDEGIQRESVNSVLKSFCIELSEQGVSASFRAGIPSIAVPNRYTVHQDFSLAHCVLNNLTREARIIQRRSLINEQ